MERRAHAAPDKTKAVGPFNKAAARTGGRVFLVCESTTTGRGISRITLFQNGVQTARCLPRGRR